MGVCSPALSLSPVPVAILHINTLIMPISVENQTQSYKNALGGRDYSIPRVESREDANNLVLPEQFNRL